MGKKRNLDYEQEILEDQGKDGAEFRNSLIDLIPGNGQR